MKQHQRKFKQERDRFMEIQEEYEFCGELDIDNIENKGSSESDADSKNNKKKSKKSKGNGKMDIEGDDSEGNFLVEEFFLKTN